MYIKFLKFYLYLLGITLLIISSSPMPSRADNTNPYSTMANAMFNMMEAMGFTGHQNNGPNNQYQNWNFSNQFQGISPWSNGGIPWDKVPWQPPTPIVPAAIDGVWLNNNGERLSIQGHRFRLESGNGRVSDGLLKIQGQSLALYQPQLKWTGVYEYVLHNNRLALRDTQGQILLYIRIR